MEINYTQLYSKAFTKCFASNSAAKGRTDYYVIKIGKVNADAASLELEITFKSGELYCCAEDGCHHGLFNRKSWVILRKIFSEFQQLKDMPKLTIEKINVIVEQGTKLKALKGIYPAKVVKKAYKYERGPYREAEATSA